ncbi:hypothetical protein [Mycolicibacterium sp.]|uniref:hypothetical protein n=1 Tax=Mycolicibacterium sp. TaxID=2320850 RepID=UPI00355D0D72
MSRYAWERGTITLPTGEPAKLRAALRRDAAAHIATLAAEVARAWSHLRTMSPAQRRKAALTGNNHVLSELSEEANSLLQQYEYRKGASHVRWRNPSQKAIREAVITRHRDHAGKTHTVYRCGHEATITLAGNTVTWDVPENNHAPERAHEHPLAGSLFGFLATVRWTSRSGGAITGNDEYNRDTDSAGGGGNYVVRAFGTDTALRRMHQLGGW